MNVSAIDVHSYARPEEALMHHLKLNIQVDFERKQIRGVAAIYFKASKDALKLVLDTKNLDINKVTRSDGQDVAFVLKEAQEHLGQALEIEIVPSDTVVLVQYNTTEGAEALQWLSPEQTAGKLQPFLFTQSQAILARTWIPLQDSPGIRFSYEADVKVPTQLMALMSAANPKKKNESGTYHFVMDKPIPAYLMALAVGDVAFSPLGERTGVYTEPGMLEKCAYELADMEKMLMEAEALYGAYQWGRYDVIVLPPSFPFGGMENPKLTFATPTIIAGDRSLTSLIAHELAHSWSGNLVTNATWNDFWLNEGFTVYFEMRIMEALYGASYSEMLAYLEMEDLKAEVAEMQANGMAADTRLKLDLAGRNPDDGVTTIAYNKGYFFLRTLEKRIGRENFDNVLRSYFQTYAFKSMNTDGFLAYMGEQLNKYQIKDADALMKEWIFEEGLPQDLPTVSAARFDSVSLALESWIGGKSLSELKTASWSSHEWVFFIRSLPKNLNLDQMKALDMAFGFTKSGNSEVLCAWLVPVISQQYKDGYGKLEDFLVNTGRRKFLTPLYGEMIKTEEGKQMALDIYRKARPNYHFVAANTLDKMIGWTGNI